MSTPLKKSLTPVSHKDTKNKSYSDFDILKSLKKNTNRLLNENEFPILAVHFGIEISHLRSLVHTVVHSRNWI